MTDGRMTDGRPVFDPDPPDRRSLEGRASFGLKAIAALNAFAVVLGLISTAIPTARLWTASFSVASGLLIVLFILEARGLDRWRPWAVSLVRPLLVVIAVAGTYAFAVTILHGRLRVPFDVALALWALRRRPEANPTPPLSGRSLGALGGAIGLSAVMLFAQPLFDWGGVLDVREADVHTTLAVECGTADAAGVVPGVITITYDWSWTNSSPLPDGLDAIVIGWNGDDSLGRPLYLIGPTPDPERGVYSGRFRYPSETMQQAVSAESRGSWHWGIELDQRGYAPGHITVELQRAQAAPPDPEPVTIKATYVHLGVWRQDASPVTCTW
jgi:hypothetical protein